MITCWQIDYGKEENRLNNNAEVLPLGTIRIYARLIQAQKLTLTTKHKSREEKSKYQESRYYGAEEFMSALGPRQVPCLFFF